jgi:hypothetical protein
MSLQEGPVESTPVQWPTLDKGGEEIIHRMLSSNCISDKQQIIFSIMPMQCLAHTYTKKNVYLKFKFRARPIA